MKNLRGFNDEFTKETIYEYVVNLLLSVRNSYLRLYPRQAKTHWDQIQARMRLAAKTSTGIAEWHSSLCRTLKIGAPTIRCAQTLADLRGFVITHSDECDFLDLVEREHGYLVALTRLASEQRKKDEDQ